jgi:hypothetical protein
MAVVPGVAIPLNLIITRFVDFVGGGVGNGGKKCRNKAVNSK